METAEIKALIVNALCDIAPELEPDEIPADEDLRDAVDLDSMDFLRLVAAVGKQTGVEISEADYRKVLSLEDMVSYVLAKGS